MGTRNMRRCNVNASVRDLLGIEAAPSRWIVFAALTLAVLVPEIAAAQYTLERVVLVSRHGVRAPTDTNPPLAEVASRTWPA